MTYITEIARQGSALGVYNVPGPAIPWDMELRKPVLGGKTALGGDDVIGKLAAQIESEFQRVIGYMVEAPEGKSWTRHATLEEMMEYLENRH